MENVDQKTVPYNSYVRLISDMLSELACSLNILRPEIHCFPSSTANDVRLHDRSSNWTLIIRILTIWRPTAPSNIQLRLADIPDIGLWWLLIQIHRDDGDTTYPPRQNAAWKPGTKAIGSNLSASRAILPAFCELLQCSMQPFQDCSTFLGARSAGWIVERTAYADKGKLKAESSESHSGDELTRHRAEQWLRDFCKGVRVWFQSQESMNMDDFFELQIAVGNGGRSFKFLEKAQHRVSKK
ncbi:hypothetical protein K456DRAFT_59112 [Colletotrichum gloeosporioides 23]|nr:hypothetical protein K456DRAFT_59112 [Colletotrichum gloeosporioides 23]